MNAKCFKFVDLGDGVTLVCALDARHDGPCGPRRSDDMHTQCCGFSADIGEAACIRVKGHKGPHKDGTERPRAEA